MGYVEDYDLLYDTENDLHKKVTRALDVAARDILSEDPTTPNHDVRMRWAEDLRTHPDKIPPVAHEIMPRVLDNPTIAADGNLAKDQDVQFQVNSIVTAMAQETADREDAAGARAARANRRTPQ